jgi:AraC family transcriptional regulator
MRRGPSSHEPRPSFWTRSWPCARVELARLPQHAPGAFTSVSTPASLAVSFTGHHRSTWAIDDACVDGDVVPGACQVVGNAEVRWLRVREPAECLELVPAPALLAEYGGAPRLEDVADRAPARDAIVHAVALRLKQVVVRELPFDALAAEELVRLVCDRRLPQSGDDGPPLPPRLERVFAYVEAHLADDLDLTRLAAAAGVSVFHFARNFRAVVGTTPSVYVRARRMEHAAELLRHTRQPIAQVALQCGYESTSHFHAAFRGHHGVPPGAARA